MLRPDDLVRESAAFADDSSDLPGPIDLAMLSTREPEPPRHVVDEWIPEGEVTLFASDGGLGKSQIALYVGVCVALGRSPWLGAATATRPVVYLSAEDSAQVLHWRLARLCAWLGVGLASLRGRLTVLDWSHVDAELMVGMPDVGMMTTAAYDALREHAAGTLLILDGASDLYGGSEIVRRDVRKFLRTLRQLAADGGAVLLLAHVDKAAARDSATGSRYSGSTAWNNSVRARWSLARDTTDDAIVLELAKTQHSAPGAQVRLTWDVGRHLYLPTATASGIEAAVVERVEQRGILRSIRGACEAGVTVPIALQGSRTAYMVLSQRPEFPEALRGDSKDRRRRFARHLEVLRQIRHVQEREIRRGNRHTSLVLELTSEGCAECAAF